MLIMGDKDLSYDSELLYNQLSLQDYILFASQKDKDGLIDNPIKGLIYFILIMLLLV